MKSSQKIFEILIRLRCAFGRISTSRRSPTSRTKTGERSSKEKCERTNAAHSTGWCCRTRRESTVLRMVLPLIMRCDTLRAGGRSSVGGMRSVRQDSGAREQFSLYLPATREARRCVGSSSLLAEENRVQRFSHSYSWIVEAMGLAGGFFAMLTIRGYVP